MKWVKEDLELYLEGKEYVDTIVLPLIPYHLSQDTQMGKSAFHKEVLQIFVQEIEKELHGRVMLLPQYNYLTTADKAREAERLNSWTSDAKKQPFKYIFYVTFDAAWKKNEKVLEGTLLWLPGIQSGNLESSQMHSFIHDQVEQVGELIKSFWQE